LPSDAIEVGIRPNAINLVSEGGIPARVVLVERLGGSSLLHVRMEGVPSLLTIEMSGSLTPSTRDEVQLGFAPGAIYAFDQAGTTLQAE
jgi:ABC-type sugar transport system ATPase subunit